MDDLSEKISKYIVDGLRKKNLTQRQLADKMDKSYSVVSSWVRGKHKPTTEDLFLLQEIIGGKIISFDDSQEDSRKEIDEISRKIETLQYTLTTLMLDLSKMIKTNTDFSMAIGMIVAGKKDKESIDKCKKIAEQSDNEYLKQICSHIENNNLASKT